VDATIYEASQAQNSELWRRILNLAAWWGFGLWFLTDGVSNRNLFGKIKSKCCKKQKKTSTALEAQAKTATALAAAAAASAATAAASAATEAGKVAAVEKINVIELLVRDMCCSLLVLQLNNDARSRVQGTQKALVQASMNPTGLVLSFIVIFIRGFVGNHTGSI
jgi:hypothetical protein